MAAERVKRLKDLTDLLSRLPPSAERDRLLDEVRSRAVDVDTGVTPRAMLPLHEPALSPVPARVAPRSTERRGPNRVTFGAQPQRARAVEPTPAAEPARHSEPVVWSAERLSLDDSPLPHGDHAVAPWTLGLRG
jgi:hypothetical protein